ncbi:MAG: hypothetical protein JXA61_06990 [Bacteroidales bacterium]|nr:hypothetical protein [Bacteroidales bacterium]
MNTIKRFRRLIAIALVACSLSFQTVYAQILNDTSSLELIKSGVDCVYNFQFDQANEVYRQVKMSYAGHPISYLFRALITYWENYPLIPGSPAVQSFEDDLYTCINLCNNEFPPEHEAEYLMTNLGARGLLLLFYADNEISMEVLSLAASTYKYVKQAFDFTGTYQDFYFITGLYNYYREAYPEAHPIYKPLALLFPRGDKVNGLKELNLAAGNAIFLKAEAFTFLSGIYISFENNYQRAYYYSKTLHELYPANVQYLSSYIKNLLLIKRYDEAENMISQSRKTYQNQYLEAQLDILHGILYEKKYHNLSLARYYYAKGLNGTIPFGVFAGEFNAYAYFGLSRISDSVNDSRMARNYRKQALDQADYENVTFDD